MAVCTCYEAHGREHQCRWHKAGGHLGFDYGCRRCVEARRRELLRELRDLEKRAAKAKLIEG